MWFSRGSYLDIWLWPFTCLICIQYLGISIKNCHELHPEPVYSFAGTPYTQQSYKVSDTFPYKWINKKWRDGFYVTSMATAGNRWAVVMSRNAGFSEQVAVLFHSTCPSAFIFYTWVWIFYIDLLVCMQLISRLLNWTSCIPVRESIRGGTMVTA